MCFILNNFRYDINGLRAIAVIAVVFFHFIPNIIPGGFAGVDVFFVISGFLMTGIVFRGIENNSFNLFKFYIARANRIIPALAALCFTLLLFGWFLLSPTEYKILAKHITSSLGFVSNLTYLKESGYFDAASHEKWLLHTWSLSVEWQFYLIYPAMLLFFKKYISLNNIKKLLVVFTFILFFGGWYATINWPESAYYLLPNRAWEMIFGGLAYLYPINLKNTQKKIIEWLGILLLLLSFLFINNGVAWPGGVALLPVLAAYFVIISNRQKSFLTNNVVFQSLGKWSYSIYLWHWPFVVFGYNFIDLPHWWLFGLPLSIIFGVISYKFVEKYKYPIFESWRETLKVKSIRYSFIVLLMSASVMTLDGFNVSFRPMANTVEAKLIDKYKNYEMDPSGLFLKCNASKQIKKTGNAQVDNVCVSDFVGGIFLWGDSHMGALSTGIRKNIPQNMPFSQLTSSGCAPSFEIKRNENSDSRFDIGCNYSNDIAYDSIKKTKPSIVILGSAGGHAHNDWLKTVSTLKEIGVKKIIIVGPFPQWRPSLPSIYIKGHLGEIFIQDDSLDKKVIENNEYLKKLRNENDSFIFINMFDSLCKTEEKILCRAKVRDELIVFDYGHLTLQGSDFVVKEYLFDYF